MTCKWHGALGLLPVSSPATWSRPRGWHLGCHLALCDALAPTISGRWGERASGDKPIADSDSMHDQGSM